MYIQMEDVISNSAALAKTRHNYMNLYYISTN